MALYSQLPIYKVAYDLRLSCQPVARQGVALMKPAQHPAKGSRALTPAHHELLRLLARLLAADYVAERQGELEKVRTDVSGRGVDNAELSGPL